MTHSASKLSGPQEIAGNSELVLTLLTPVTLVRRHLPAYESQRDQGTQTSCCTPMLCNSERFPPHSLHPKLACGVEYDSFYMSYQMNSGRGRWSLGGWCKAAEQMLHLG